MTPPIKFGMAQINPTLGDLDGNSELILNYIRKAFKESVDLLIFPELALSGYSPRDLLFDANFISENVRYLDEIAQQVPADLTVVLGFPDRQGGGLYNAAAVIRGGKIVARRYKTLLPNYDVFDEQRYFRSATDNVPVALAFGDREVRVGIEICEDLWDRDSAIKVTERLAALGADLIVNISASPFEHNKRDIRKQLIRRKVSALKIPFVLVNLVGGQDEFVFDGNSIAFDAALNPIAWGGEFKESLTTFELDSVSGMANSIKLPQIEKNVSIFSALVLGVRDYFRKTGGTQAILGLSGGVDSALVACIAAEALSPEKVICISMPGPYTAEMSVEDAGRLAQNLGTRFEIIRIDDIAQGYYKCLKPLFKNTNPDVTEENIQSRIRGNILMAIANKFGGYVLNTGNKTELALGYCTMYGDMAGALAVISDLSKAQVYALCDWLNRYKKQKIIPARIIGRTPSAELAPGQVDPFDYTIVSPLVDYIINDRKTRAELIALGFDTALVDDILNRIRLMEFKRRQAPPGLKITSKAFGIGRRFPIINHFKDELR